MRFSLYYLLLFLSFGLHPGFEFPDGIALHRQLDMGVEGIDFLARGVAHEGLPHVLQDPGLHQPGVERVAKIMKTDVAYAGIFQCRLPRAFDDAHRFAVEADDEPFGLALLEQQLKQPLG